MPPSTRPIPRVHCPERTAGNPCGPRGRWKRAPLLSSLVGWGGCGRSGPTAWLAGAGHPPWRRPVRPSDLVTPCLHLGLARWGCFVWPEPGNGDDGSRIQMVRMAATTLAGAAPLTSVACAICGRPQQAMAVRGLPPSPSVLPAWCHHDGGASGLAVACCGAEVVLRDAPCLFWWQCCGGDVEQATTMTTTGQQAWCNQAKAFTD
jgi:hypothetical protein